MLDAPKKCVLDLMESAKYANKEFVWLRVRLASVVRCSFCAGSTRLRTMVLRSDRGVT